MGINGKAKAQPEDTKCGDRRESRRRTCRALARHPIDSIGRGDPADKRVANRSREVVKFGRMKVVTLFPFATKPTIEAMSDKIHANALLVMDQMTWKGQLGIVSSKLEDTSR